MKIFFVLDALIFNLESLDQANMLPAGKMGTKKYWLPCTDYGKAIKHAKFLNLPFIVTPRKLLLIYSIWKNFVPDAPKQSKNLT